MHNSHGDRQGAVLQRQTVLQQQVARCCQFWVLVLSTISGHVPEYWTLIYVYAGWMLFNQTCAWIVLINQVSDHLDW